MTTTPSLVDEADSVLGVRGPSNHEFRRPLGNKKATFHDLGHSAPRGFLDRIRDTAGPAEAAE